MRTKMTESSYEIVPVQEDDHDRVIAFLRRTFFVDEPLNIAIGLLEGQPICPEDCRPGCPALEAFCREALSHGLSLVAIDSVTGNIVGVTLNAEAVPEGINELSVGSSQCPDPKFRRLLDLMAYVDKETKVFQRYEVDRLLEMRIISVDGEWRGRGIATALIKRTLDQAKELGYPLFRVDCTSAFSAKAMERVGLEKIFTLKYEDYLQESDDDNDEGVTMDNSIIETEPKKRRKQIFKPAPPHYAVAAYVKQIKGN